MWCLKRSSLRGSNLKEDKPKKCKKPIEEGSTTTASSAGSCTPPPSALTPITVGSNNYGTTKTVSVPENTWCPPTCGPGCRLNTDYSYAPDDYSLSVNNGQLTVTRLDSTTAGFGTGWGMNLEVPCYATTPVNIGSQSGPITKTVAVPAGTCCPETCGPGCRLNSDYSYAPDTFNLNVQGDQLTATRMDNQSAGGWGMNLTVPCIEPITQSGPTATGLSCNPSPNALTPITVGSNNYGTTKTVSVPENTWCPPTCGPGCRLNTDYSYAPDDYSLSVNNGQLTVTRLDNTTPGFGNGWGMNLEVPCYATTPVTVGSQSGPISKTVGVPSGTCCPSTCGPGCRLNSDYSYAGDTFNLTTSGGQLTATRTDNTTAGGWGMNLQVPCIEP